jgi:CCR4-NOT transcription complex subunit 7/8
MASGFVCNPTFRWICFHGSFDFGYLLRLVSGNDLPVNVPDFFTLLKIYFPKIYDIKIITASINTLGKSLSSYGRNLEVKSSFSLNN